MQADDFGGLGLPPLLQILLSGGTPTALFGREHLVGQLRQAIQEAFPTLEVRDILVFLRGLPGHQGHLLFDRRRLVLLQAPSSFRLQWPDYLTLDARELEVGYASFPGIALDLWRSRGTGEEPGCAAVFCRKPGVAAHLAWALVPPPDVVVRLVGATTSAAD